jgi:hypothetical protein
MRVRRAQTAMEITKHHREIWMYYDEHPEIHTLFDRDRDMIARPLTGQEAHFVTFLLNHIRVTFYDRNAGIYVQPQALNLDIRMTFSYPGPRDVWRRVKKYHDAKFVAFIDGIVA